MKLRNLVLYLAFGRIQGYTLEILSVLLSQVTIIGETILQNMCHALVSLPDQIA